MDLQSSSPSMFEDVAKFHTQILEVLPPLSPIRLDKITKREKFKFLREELDEFYDTDEFAEEIDALLDIIYVALGSLYSMGVDVPKCWGFVQAANMTKKKGVTSRGNKIDAVKPPDFVKPEVYIQQYLDENKP